MLDIIIGIVGVIYIIISYWAVNYVWWSRRVYITADPFQMYLGRIVMATVFGIFFVPIAIIMKICGK